KVTDGTLTSANSGTVTITVNATGANAAPSAGDNSYVATENTTLNAAAPGVLGNDSDTNNDKLSAVLLGNATHRPPLSHGDGSFSYTPAIGFSGTDSFTYRASDGQAQSGLATATITVNFVNTAPVARNDSAGSTLQNTPLTVAAPGVLANDT